MMNKEMTMARIRLIGNMNNYDLQRVMLKEIEGTLEEEVQGLFLEVKQNVLEDRFHHLDQAFDRMKEENVGTTYRAAMRSIVEEIHKVQAERFQVLEDRAKCETDLKKITILGNLVRGYESREKKEEAKQSMIQALACIEELEGDKRQIGWQTLIDPLAGSMKWTEELLSYCEEMKGKTLREFYVALISSAAKEGDANQAFDRTMEAVSVLKDQESMDVYFVLNYS
jgi:hypothetical protein